MGSVAMDEKTGVVLMTICGLCGKEIPGEIGKNDIDLCQSCSKLLKGNFAVVVRCKDCKFWKDDTERDKHPSWLPCMEIQTRGGFYCADGKRKGT